MSNRFTRNVGEPLRLQANLLDGEIDRFVSASIWQADGVQIAGPFNLDHIAEGIHVFNGTVLMPNFGQVLVKYKVYFDAQRLSIDDCYEQPVDIFELDSFDPALIRPVAASITAKVEASRVIGRIEGKAAVDGRIEDEFVEVRLEENAQVTGTIEQEQNITGGLDD